MDHLSYLVIVLYLYILPDDGIGAQKERQPHDKSQTQLPDKLYLGIEPVLAFLEIFDIVVGKAQNAQPDGCDNHQDEIDVAQAAKQQYGHKHGNDDDDATHGRHAEFVHAVRINLRITLRLGDVAALHEPDEVTAEPCRYGKGENQGQQGAERDVVPHARAGNAELVKKTEEIVQHIEKELVVIRFGF